MTRTRLVIAGLPRLARGIVGILAAELPTVDIVAELDSGDDPVEAAALHSADVVLVSASAEDARLGERMLMANPRLRILTLSDDGRSATLHRLLPHRMMIEDVSLNDLFDAMLGAGRYGSAGWGA